MNAVTEVMDELRKALAELEDCRARNADMRTMLEQVTRERDEARAACPDCAMWAERSARWHDDMQRAERERDEARADAERYLADLRRCASEPYERTRELEALQAEVGRLRKDYDSVLEANVGLLDGAPYVDARAAFRRGAEAMREACAQWFREHDESFELTVDACHDVIADMPIPEEP